MTTTGFRRLLDLRRHGEFEDLFSDLDDCEDDSSALTNVERLELSPLTDQTASTLALDLVNFPFLKLAPETRNHIYRLLLVSSQRLNAASAVGSIHPAILSVNRQIQAEASSIFYGENYFFCTVDHTGIAFASGGNGTLYRHYRGQWKHCIPEAQIPLIRRLEVRISVDVHDECKPRSQSFDVERANTIADNLRELVQSLLQGPPLDELEIRLFDLESVAGPRVLTPFESLRNIKRATVVHRHAWNSPPEYAEFLQDLIAGEEALASDPEYLFTRWKARQRETWRAEEQEAQPSPDTASDS
ncbi:MAG: hypothetical protein M1817_000869 [Caeruleum heppii]|nr:MAG: hypothetical protein M1817_000869 [Caeruleum heppii]